MSDRALEIIAREICYEGYYRLERLTFRHRTFAGSRSASVTREVIEKGDVVAALLYDPALDRLVMIEQVRIGAREDPRGPWLLEVVAGMIEPGESPEDVVRREAMEEAGCLVTDLLQLTTFYTSPAKTSQRCHLFCARVDASRAGGVHGLAHEGEDIRAVPLPVTDALTLVENGRVDSAVPLVALLWFMRHREAVRERWLNGAAS